MAGKDMREKRKKHKKSRVVIPADSGRLLAIQYHKSVEAPTVRVAKLTNIVDARPNSPQHHLYAGSTDARLDTIPNTGGGIHQATRHTTKEGTYHAMAARLNTHHRLPHMPKDMRATTGKVTCSIAPGRAFSTIKGATRE